MNAIAFLRSEVENGRVIGHKHFLGQDVPTIWKLRSQGFTNARTGVSFAIKRIVASRSESFPHEIDAIKTFVENIVQGEVQSVVFDSDIYRDAFCADIATDVTILAKALYLGIDDPLLNAIWMMYRIGRIPTKPLKVDGKLTDFLEVDAKKASTLLKDAGRRLAREQEEERRSKEAARAAIETRDRKIAAVDGMPGPDLLKEILWSLPAVLHESPESRIVVSPDGLGRLKIPDGWRALLEAQNSRIKMPWETVWSSVEERFSAVRDFLKKSCLGVAVLDVPGKSPALLYVYARKWDTPSKRMFSAYRGGYPTGKSIPAAAKKFFRHFSAELQEFYRSVHDGWCSFGYFSEGPLPLANLHLMNRDISDRQAWEDVDEPPFRLKDLVVLVKNGRGDCLCLDTANKEAPAEQRGVYYIHDAPEESKQNLDLWKEINKRIRSGLDDALPTKKKK